MVGRISPSTWRHRPQQHLPPHQRAPAPLRFPKLPLGIHLRPRRPREDSENLPRNCQYPRPRLRTAAKRLVRDNANYAGRRPHSGQHGQAGRPFATAPSGANRAEHPLWPCGRSETRLSGQSAKAARRECDPKEALGTRMAPVLCCGDRRSATPLSRKRRSLVLCMASAHSKATAPPRVADAVQNSAALARSDLAENRSGQVPFHSIENSSHAREIPCPPSP